jgi:RNA polymerase sigma-70 factor (ECF subfamily)
MQQVKNGKTDKLGILFEQYKRPLFGYFYRNTSLQLHSEDMVQSVFWRILKYRHTFDENGLFATWLYQIAHRVLIDSWRKKKLDIENDSDNIVSEDRTADEKLIEDESIELLRTALQRLDKSQREILIMSKYQNLKYRDIGAILNCTEGAVKVRIFRALQELKTIFKHLEGQ